MRSSFSILFLLVFVLTVSACGTGEDGSSPKRAAEPAAAGPGEVSLQPDSVVSDVEPVKTGPTAVWEPEPEEEYDPMPVESPSAPVEQAGHGQQEPAPKEVVPFEPGVDPFARLGAPVTPQLADSDPRADTLRLGPEVPPEPGQKVEPFPPTESVGPPPEVQVRALAVVRHSPDGAVDLVDAVTASFSQPMVPLASLPELDSTDAPLRITPPVAGRFLWLGTDTVAFRPEAGRMPFATRYTATVAAGTAAPNGARLEEPFEFNFTTPRPDVVSASPYDDERGVRPDASIRLTFNATVDPDEVLKQITLSSPASQGIALKVVRPEPPAKEAENLVDRGEQRVDFTRTVEFKPVEPLTLGTWFTLKLGAQLVCAEGPAPAGEERHFKFATYFPLAVEKISCHWDDEDCYPGATLNIEFNNSLPVQKVDELIAITPKPDGLRYKVSGNRVSALGMFLPSTSYKVEARPGFKDVYEQINAAGRSGTVHYRRARPFLRFVREGLVVLEARQSHDFLLMSMNLSEARLKMARVSTANLPDYVRRVQTWESFETECLADSECAVNRELKLSSGDNTVVRTDLSLDEALGDSGHGFVFVDVKSRRSRGFFKGFDQFRRKALVQVTDLGLTVAMATDKMVVYVTRLSDAAPVPDAKLSVFRLNTGGTLQTHSTNSQGIAHLDGPEKMSGEGPYLLVASQGDDAAFLVLDGSGEGGYLSSYNYTQRSRDLAERSASLVFSERGLYRPAEEVYVSLVVRKRTRGPEGDVVPLAPEERSATWVVTDPRGNEVAKGELSLTPFGTGHFTLTTDKNAPLGRYHVRVDGTVASAHGTFQVEEFRTPEYEVSASWKTGDENILVGRKLAGSISGRYFFGGAMAGAEVEWSLYRQASGYSPPGNPGFDFSDVDPSNPGSPWDWDEESGRSRQWVRGDSAKLDGAGRLDLELELTPGSIRRDPVTFILEAEVYDQNRQAIAASSAVLAHRAERYVGVAVDRSVVAAKETVEVSAVVTRLDGSRYEKADVTVTLVKTTWDENEVVDDEGDVSYARDYRETEVGQCSVKAGDKPGRCTLVVPAAGTYLVRALTLDKAGRKARSALNLYAYGEGETSWTSSRTNKVELVPDKPEYRPGDRARVLIQSPFEKATGLLMISREGIVKTEKIEITNGSLAYELPIEERWMPSIALCVALVRGRVAKPGATPDDRGRPSFAYGGRSLSVSRASRAITLQLNPSVEAMDPGATFTLGLQARDHVGKPVQANVALMIVDEGVLSLIAWATPNPLNAIFRSVSSGTSMADLRPLVVPRMKPKVEMEAESDGDDFGGAPIAQMAMDEEALMEESKSAPPRRARAMKKKAPGKGGGGGMDDQAPAFAVRELFKSTAYFNGELRTGEDGTLSVEIKMPDNLTRFRIMAVAADEGVRVGSGDSQVRTRLPLIVRPALPRFLNMGDRFRAAAVVNNETGVDTEVMVRCLADNAEIDGESVKTLAVKAGKAREVSFDARAGTPGPASFQFAAVALTTKRQTDAAYITIPTLIPATSEAFATYGVVEDAVRQPLSPPRDALPDFGGLEVAMSSTALTGLQDAAAWLFDYPYECTEQICSRIMPIIALKDVLADFKLGEAETPERARMLVAEGLKKLYNHQRSDGGFGYWPGSRESWLYVSAYAAMTMDLASRAGFTVPQHRLDNAAAFLENRLDHPHDWEAWAYGSQTMAVLVLARLDRAALKHMKRLYGLATKRAGQGQRPAWNELSLFARAWLLEAYGRLDPNGKEFAELYRQVSNAAVETAGAIHFAEGKRESLKLMMHSEDRTDAIVLNTLLAVKQDDPMVDKLVRGLVRSRTHGRWSTTQANAWALHGLAEYYRIFEKAEPDFAARLWQGKQYLTGHRFKGRQMDIVKSSIPMAALFSQAGEDLILAKKGPGRLYYRLGLKYAPADLKLKPEERGFTVQRIYLPEGEDGQLTRRPDGTWVAKAGTYVRVKLQIIAPDRRYYVAVVDPLPAGLEAVNESFATTAGNRLGADKAVNHHTRRRWYWDWNPWDYTEKRDDRVQLFMDSMWGGVYEYTYVTRATTIGEFVVPPARAEEMYEAETFGRNGTAGFVVEP